MKNLPFGFTLTISKLDEYLKNSRNFNCAKTAEILDFFVGLRDARPVSVEKLFCGNLRSIGYGFCSRATMLFGATLFWVVLC
jgi:hypothetical protein